jgi:glycerate 2-kinase
LCLLSGGGSALLPAPVSGITLPDKQRVTLLLHGCGATINEMNAVRKHLSRCKGGQLACAFKGRLLHSLIISDVVGDPLDVIASGPTSADPTTFAQALDILRKYDLLPSGSLEPQGSVPFSVVEYLERGLRREEPETLKVLPANITNHVIGNNQLALGAAVSRARELGYSVLNLGSHLEGETRQLAGFHAGLVRAVQRDGIPVPAPACILSGGETTVALPRSHGLGGRNQEFVLAAIHELGPGNLGKTVVLSGGTDGEDGPTDAAGAIGDVDTLARAADRNLEPAKFLTLHDAYHFFASTNDLLKTGLTETNVMDLRLLLIA